MSVGPFTRRSILSEAALLAASPAVVAPAYAQSDYPAQCGARWRSSPRRSRFSASLK